jgi:3-deoxy-D-manno-octulosonic-acid transferase
MIIFYNLFLFFLKPIYEILRMISSKVQSFHALRKQSKLNILHLEIPSTKKVIWLHAASVGELDQCKAIAKVIKQESSLIYIVQSVFSMSVSMKNFDSSDIDFYFYLPLDFPKNYNFIFRKLKPSILIIAAWDIWPNLVLSANQFHCKVFLACGSLHLGSKRLKHFISRKLTKEILSRLSGISPSSETSVNLFRVLASSTEVYSCGDSRFDSVAEKIEKNLKAVDHLEIFRKEKIIILASTYSNCDDILFPSIKELLKRDYKIWLFPHKIDQNRINEIIYNLNKYNLSYKKYTDMNFSNKDNIIIFNIIGLLAFAYKKAFLCYVGGGFHNRVHNVIEPAYFGLPICTGEKITHASEALDLKNKNYLTVIKNSDDFITFCNTYENITLYSETKENIKIYVSSKRGSSLMFYNHFIRKEIL